MSAIQNYGGVKAAERDEDYLKRSESADKEQSVDKPWWGTSKASLILVPIFSVMDGMVLFSIFDACLTQSAVMGIVMAFGVAVVLNVLPLIMAKFAHQTIYKIKRQALTMLLVTALGFFLIFAGTVYLRFAYSDMYENESQTTQLENTVSNDVTVSDVDNNADANKSFAVVLLLSLSPLVTSIIGFAITYVTDDEVRNFVEFYERRDVELDEAISDLESAIETMSIDVERDIDLDEQAMEAAIEEVIARAETLKAIARRYLAEYLANPRATSKLSEEMLLRNNQNDISDTEVTGEEKMKIAEVRMDRQSA